MGAISFCHLVEGEKIGELFDDLVEEARRTHGDDSYNGTISTCHLNRRASKTYDTYSKKNEEDARKWIREVEQYGEKWEARYVDLGIVGYDVISVKKKTLKANAEFKMQYCVYLTTYEENDKLLAYKDTKKAADDVAIKYALEGKNVYVKKEYIKLKGNAQTTSFEITTKRYKTKPKLKDMENRRIVPVRRFYLYGMAAC